MWPVRPATAKAATTITTTTTTTRTVCRRRTSRQQAALGAAGRSHECQLSLRLAPSEILCQSIPETSYVTRWVPRPQRGARSTGRTTAASPIHWPSVARNERLTEPEGHPSVIGTRPTRDRWQHQRNPSVRLWVRPGAPSTLDSSRSFFVDLPDSLRALLALDQRSGRCKMPRYGDGAEK